MISNMPANGSDGGFYADICRAFGKDRLKRSFLMLEIHRNLVDEKNRSGLDHTPARHAYGTSYQEDARGPAHPWPHGAAAPAFQFFPRHFSTIQSETINK
jgi:hypothetical protein